MKKTLLKTMALCGALILGLGLNSQAATITVNSTSGTPYSVTISVTPTALIPSSTTSCASGYNYNIQYDYAVSYSAGAPGNLYTLQFIFKCGSTTLGAYPASNAAGSYTSLVTTTNPWTNMTNCATATLASNNCVATLDIIVEGPGIANQTITVSNPLPLNLISFDAMARGNEVLLNWVSSSATASNYFVERSNNASNWATIGTATAQQALNGSYQFMDKQPLEGTNYYRLRIQSNDGSATYSHTIFQKIVGDGQQIVVYPNPANTDRLSISGLNNPTDWTVQLSNTLSQELMKTALTNNQITIPAVPSGLYFLRFTNASTKESKLIKLMKD